MGGNNFFLIVSPAALGELMCFSLRLTCISCWELEMGVNSVELIFVLLESSPYVTIYIRTTYWGDVENKFLCSMWKFFSLQFLWFAYRMAVCVLVCMYTVFYVCNANVFVYIVKKLI